MYPEEKTEAQWQAEEDANTLARAEEIKEDAGRLEKAKEAASRMVKEEEDRARAMRKIAGRKTNKSQQEFTTGGKVNKNIFGEINKL